MIEIVNGDILTAKEDVICHQVNCMGNMGAGVAKSICQRWPVVKKEYVRFCRRYPKATLLGKCQLVEIESNRYVANIFGQFDYGGNRYHRYTDYNALTQAFHELRSTYKGKSLAFPYGFGCGLANGDWNIVSDMLHTYFDDMDVRIYKYNG